jgi:hypothetical protein
MTKKAARTRGKQMRGDGERMIASAEFRFGISKEISREQFDSEIKEGNRLICNGLDLIEATYAANWQELAAVICL